MRASLQTWINDADKARHLGQFSGVALPIELAQISNRSTDYYISLVGELFDGLHSTTVSDDDRAQLGNAFLQFSKDMPAEQIEAMGISKNEAALFAAAAFYFGNFPASACLAMRQSSPPADPLSPWAACYDFLARPETLVSQTAHQVQEILLICDALWRRALARRTTPCRLGQISGWRRLYSAAFWPASMHRIPALCCRMAQMHSGRR